MEDTMMTTTQINEAFCDAWAIAGKPDDTWTEYSRASMGWRTELRELFVAAFESGRDSADQREATAHMNGYEMGHDDGMQRGQRQGVMTVLAMVEGGDWPDLAKQLAEKYPKLWEQTVIDANTGNGDGS